MEDQLSDSAEIDGLQIVRKIEADGSTVLERDLTLVATGRSAQKALHVYFCHSKGI